jgi:transposase
MKREASEGIQIPVKDFSKRAADATGVPSRTVRRVVNERKYLESKECPSTSISTPGKNRSKPSLKSTVDNFDEEVIRRSIYNFAITEDERPTVKNLHAKLVEHIAFSGSKSSLPRLLKKLGFKWKRTQNNRKVLTDREDIRFQRTTFIRRTKQYKKENRLLMYTDETYIHSTHTTQYSWSDVSDKSVHVPVAKGRKLIIAHAGGEAGFVPNALLIFKSNSKTCDFHDEINNENNIRWLNEKLIPNLPPSSVIVLDNASYHNVQGSPAPTSNSTNKSMQYWLTDRNIPFSVNMFKTELYELIKLKTPHFRCYKVDTLLAKHAHSFLRLPPYHPGLNPIEKIWALVKNWVASHNITFKTDDIVQLLYKFSSVKPEDWASRCRRVQ